MYFQITILQLLTEFQVVLGFSSASLWCSADWQSCCECLDSTVGEPIRHGIYQQTSQLVTKPLCWKYDIYYPGSQLSGIPSPTLLRPQQDITYSAARPERRRFLLSWSLCIDRNRWHANSTLQRLLVILRLLDCKLANPQTLDGVSNTSEIQVLRRDTFGSTDEPLQQRSGGCRSRSRSNRHRRYVVRSCHPCYNRIDLRHHPWIPGCWDIHQCVVLFRWEVLPQIFKGS